MTNRKKIIALALIIILVLVAIVLLVKWRDSAQKEALLKKETGSVQPIATPPAVVPLLPQDNVSAGEQSIETSAKIFAESYGSFSNESYFQNLRDLYPIMTESFKEETEAYISGAFLDSSYYGITTRVILVSVDSVSEVSGQAKVTVKTQRQESIGSPTNSSLRYQDLVLTLVRSDKTWLVDSATWSSIER